MKVRVQAVSALCHADLPFGAAEKEYLLEYYSLVREGKTNYVSNLPMLAYFGHRGQEPSEFFKVYNVSIMHIVLGNALRYDPGGVQAQAASHHKERRVARGEEAAHTLFGARQGREAN